MNEKKKHRGTCQTEEQREDEEINDEKVVYISKMESDGTNKTIFKDGLVVKLKE